MESLYRYYKQQPGTDRFGHQEDAYFLGERVRGAVLDMLRCEHFASALRGYMKDSGCSTRRKELSHYGAVPKRCNERPEAYDMGNKFYALVMYCMQQMKTCNNIYCADNDADDPLTFPHLNSLTIEHLGDVIEAFLAPSQLDNIFWESHGKFGWNFEELTSLHQSYFLDEGDFKLNICMLKVLAAVEDVLKHLHFRIPQGRLDEDSRLTYREWARKILCYGIDKHTCGTGTAALTIWKLNLDRERRRISEAASSSGKAAPKQSAERMARQRDRNQARVAFRKANPTHNVPLQKKNHGY